jgi:hypothetical protein
MLALGERIFTSECRLMMQGSTCPGAFEFVGTTEPRAPVPRRSDGFEGMHLGARRGSDCRYRPSGAPGNVVGSSARVPGDGQVFPSMTYCRFTGRSVRPVRKSIAGGHGPPPGVLRPMSYVNAAVGLVLLVWGAGWVYFGPIRRKF